MAFNIMDGLVCVFSNLHSVYFIFLSFEEDCAQNGRLALCFHHCVGECVWIWGWAFPPPQFATLPSPESTKTNIVMYETVSLLS